MKHQIKQEQGVVNVEIEQFEGKHEKVLAALQECQQGRCTCPTNEYEKLQTLDIENAADRIKLRLTPKPGQQLDLTEIEKCLAYTGEQVGGAE